MPSSQLIGVPGTQLPPWHESPTVHTLLSEQVFESSGVPMQAPDCALQVSSVQELPSLHPFWVPGTQTPESLHEPMRQATSSEQEVCAARF
jgi:hypothetical protein